MINKRILLNYARTGMGRARAPYSGFHVGAAVECENGEIFIAGNVEAANSAVGICAERAALSMAVASTDSPPKQIAIIAEEPGTSCGMCRQFMVEFPKLRIHTINEAGDTVTRSPRQLLPKPYERRTK